MWDCQYEAVVFLHQPKRAITLNFRTVLLKYKKNRTGRLYMTFMCGFCVVEVYLISISCRPASVGEYFTVTVPSLLSVISGLATFPEGILTSPVRHWVHEILLCKSVKQKYTDLNEFSTCNFSLLDGERNDQVEGSQPSYVQSIHTQLSVCSLGGRRGKSDRS